MSGSRGQQEQGLAGAVLHSVWSVASLNAPLPRHFFLIVTRNLEREGWDLEGEERKKRREMGEKRKKERRREETPVSAEAERSSSWG